MVNARTKKDETVAAAPVAAAPAAATAAPVKKAKAAAPKKESEHPPYKVNTSTIRTTWSHPQPSQDTTSAIIMERRHPSSNNKPNNITMEQASAGARLSGILSSPSDGHTTDDAHQQAWPYLMTRQYHLGHA